MSVQLASRHFFQARDTVQDVDGILGEVVEGRALYATIQWADGRREEVDQFDPDIVVIDRAEAA